MKHLRVYQYGARAPHEIENVMAQMRAGHDYYNDCIAAERRRRQAYDDLVKSDRTRELDAELKSVEAAIDSAKKEAAEMRQRLGAAQHLADAAGKREIAPLKRAALAESKAKREALAERRADVLKRLSEERKSTRGVALDSEIAAVAERFYAECKAAYAARKCFWGTKLIVKRAADAAIDTSRKFRKGEPPPSPPRFRRWSGEGVIACQVQAETSVDSIFGLDFDVPQGGRPGSRRSQSKRRAIARIRIGSDEHRDPIWAHVPVLIHRPLPDGAVIKWVALHRRMTATDVRWTLDVTLEVAAPPPVLGEGVAGVDLGWRRVDKGVRVAMVAMPTTVLGTPETARELVVPDRTLDRFDHADSLRSIRDRNMDTLRETLRRYIDSLPELPDWMAALEVKHMHAWKAPRRFVVLCRAWQRHDKDGYAWSALEAWRRQDRHLWQWEAHEREGAIAARRDLFRRWAHDLATSGVQRVAIEDVDLSAMAKRTEGRTEAEEQASRLRSRVAAGDLRLTMAQACKARGVEVVKVAAANTTRTCFACGHVNTFPDPAALWQTCRGCGVEWDQDVNAALNIRASGEAVEEAKAGEPAVKGGRHARLRAAKAERSKRSAEACGTPGGV